MVGQGRSVLSYFQNQGSTVRLLDGCMSAIYGLEQAEAYQAVKLIADRREAFPQERVFRYLTTQAPQI